MIISDAETQAKFSKKGTLCDATLFCPRADLRRTMAHRGSVPEVSRGLSGPSKGCRRLVACA